MALTFLRGGFRRTDHKFGAEGEKVDGQWFASKHERRRFRELQILQDAKVISGLARQVAWPLHTTSPDGKRHTIGRYIADFVYHDRLPDGVPGNWPIVVEDAKGYPTELYLWKKKHFELEYGIKIRES